jgi:hypothetical protein
MNTKVNIHRLLLKSDYYTTYITQPSSYNPYGPVVACP